MTLIPTPLFKPGTSPRPAPLYRTSTPTPSGPPGASTLFGSAGTTQGPAFGSVGESLVDLAAYPVLTEEVGYPPSPVATPSTMPGAPSQTPLGNIAAKAIADVLGWKPKAGDPKGFVGALTQSFSLSEVEGHTEARWTPRTYAVQTDLGGGISGAQASIYARASEAVDRALRLLDGLYALDIDADPQDVEALKSIVRSQLGELVNELGIAGGPRVTRVDQIFSLLLDPGFRLAPPLPQVETDPDFVGGQIGTLRDEMGLWSVTVANPAIPTRPKILINTVEEEQNVTNYRILVDYLTSLRQSWNNNKSFFGLGTTTPPFFGTQLVLLSRQLSVVADGVDEVRFTMDSVFITPSERQTLEIDFPTSPPLVNLAAHPPGRPTAITPPLTGALGTINDNRINSGPMFLEDLLSWVQRFAAEEGPRLIQDGGKFAVQNSVLPVVILLRNLVLGAVKPDNFLDLPPGYRTPRVQRALLDLGSQLDELAFLANPITHVIPSQD